MARKGFTIVGATKVQGRSYRPGDEKALKSHLEQLRPGDKAGMLQHLANSGAIEGVESYDEVPADATLFASAAGEEKDKELGQGNADSSVPIDLRQEVAKEEEETKGSHKKR
jgi:hypothetical protein